MNIDLATKEMAASIAELHQREIGQGFLSQMGVRFLKLFYEAIIESSGSFAVVARNEGGVVGFMAGSIDMPELKSFFYKKYFISILFLILPKLTNPGVIKKILETDRYVSKDDRQALPRAELISMAVSAGFREQGIASQIFSRFVQEMRRRNGLPFKVIVGEGLDKAVKFYEARGFVFHSKLIVHDNAPSKLYVYSSR